MTPLSYLIFICDDIARIYGIEDAEFEAAAKKCHGKCLGAGGLTAEEEKELSDLILNLEEPIYDSENSDLEPPVLNGTCYFITQIE